MLGPEMKSAGEAMGIGNDFAVARHKASLSDGTAPPDGQVRLTVATLTEYVRPAREQQPAKAAAGPSVIEPAEIAGPLVLALRSFGLLGSVRGE